MLWFRNAIIYQMNKKNEIDAKQIEQAVLTQPFIPCESSDSMKSGWTSPYGDSDDTPPLIEMSGQILLRFKKESKILPPAVIKQALQEKISKQENDLNRKLTKSEKSSLKDEIFIDLLPRAFSKYQYYWLWIDTVEKRFIINASSYKQAEEVLATLRKSLGSLSVMPYVTETPPEQTMTKWVKEDLSYPSLTLGDEIELKDSLEDNALVRCKNQEINTHEIYVHIDAGKIVTKMKIWDENGVSFLLNRDCTLKSIKFDSSILDKNDEYSKEESQRRLEVDFLLMSNILSSTFNSLFSIIDKRK